MRKTEVTVEIDWNLSDINGYTASRTPKESGEKSAEEEIFLYLYRVNGNEQLAQSYKRSYVSYEAVPTGSLPDYTASFQ